MIPLAERYRLPISQRTRILLVAIILVLLAGLAVAATQPGNLGDDDGDRTAAELTGTTTAEGTTPTSAAQATTTTEATGPTVTTDPGTGTESPTTTAAPGSGLGAEGSGSAGEGELADTGGLPFAVPGALLLVAAALSRRLTAR